jgi:hypothetical protein
LSFYLRDEQILVDIRKYDRRIVLPIPSLSWSCLAEVVPCITEAYGLVWLNHTNGRIVTETRPIRNTGMLVLEQCWTRLSSCSSEQLSGTENVAGSWEVILFSEFYLD